MTGGAELFVVCRSCGSEVSPYVTECPYCGNRLRKRAPRLDRPPRRQRTPRLPPLRPGEIPGVGPRPLGRPAGTIVIVALSLLGYLLWEVVGQPLWEPRSEWERLVYAPFVYIGGWYQLAVLLPVGLYGWLLERRHGTLTVLALFLVLGVGTLALSVVLEPGAFPLGAPGAAAGLLAAWAVPDLLRLRRGDPYEGDLLGTLVIAVVVCLLPLVVPEASAVATYAGLGGGLLAGLALSRTAGAR